MKITFRTKEESNRLQEETFLKLSRAERVLQFFKLSKRIKQFPTKDIIENKNNFVIDFSK